MLNLKQLTVLAIIIILGIIVLLPVRQPRFHDRGDLLAEINSGKSMMWIGPHPDDEDSVAGTIALACGDRGNECYVLALKTTEQIIEGLDPALRQEANDWLEEHYLEEYIYYPGGATNKTPEEIKSTVMNIIEEKRPEIILTFTPYGYYGHPEHKATSHMVTNICEELTYNTSLYYVINTDNFLPYDHYEYLQYPPTDIISLDAYSQNLGKTLFEAKIEIGEVYAPSVPLIERGLENPEFYSDKREYFMKVK